MRGSRRSSRLIELTEAGLMLSVARPRSSTQVMGVRQPPARKLPNLSTARVVRALELVAFHPAPARRVAATMGICDRTARLLLLTLEDEGYLERGHGRGRQQAAFWLSPRLLALAGQLAARLPLVTHGEHVVAQLHQRSGLDAYLVIPSYGDVIVLATAGKHAPRLWSLLPATASAGGHILLAYRRSWRDDQRPDSETATDLDLDALAREVRQQGYAIRHDDRGTTSIAAAVPMAPAPLAALVLTIPEHDVGDDQRDALVDLLWRAAGRIGDYCRPPQHAPFTLRVTAKDRDAGRIRVPNAARTLLPDEPASIVVRVRGTALRTRWSFRHPTGEGTLHVGRGMLDGLVGANEVLVASTNRDGTIHLD